MTEMDVEKLWIVYGKILSISGGNYRFAMGQIDFAVIGIVKETIVLHPEATFKEKDKVR